MTNKKLVLLAMTAVIMAGWAILQHRLARQTGTEGLFQNTSLIQGLNINAIAQIIVQSDQGENTLTLKEQDGRFCVMEKDGYPAIVGTITTLLNNCLDIRVARPITSNPANHADLGVTDETARYAVYFLNAQGEIITGVLLSEQKEDPRGAHVRLATSDETYFVTESPWLSTTAMSYINAVLVEVDRSKVRQVRVSGPQGEYTLTSAGDGGVTLDPMPEGKQFQGTTYRSVLGALGSVRCDDVMAAKNAPGDLVFGYTYTCQIEDLTVYTVNLARHEDRYYAVLAAEFPDQTPVQIGRSESEEELRKKEAKLLAMDAAKNFTERHKGWVYVISSFNAEDLIKPLEDLLEPLPEPDPAESAE